MKYIVSLILSLHLFFLVQVVNAQETVDIPISGYDGRHEVFDISTTEPQKVKISPNHCNSIESVEYDLEKNVNGSIKISPSNDDLAEPLQNKYELCDFEYIDVTYSQIKSIKFNLRVRQTWLESNNISKDAISFYSMLPNDWTENDLQFDREDESFVFFKSESAEKAELYSLAQSSDAVPSILDSINPSLITFCCIILLFLIFIVFLFSFIRGRTNRR